MTPLEKAQSALKKQKKKNKNKFGFDQKELQVITRKSNKTSVAQSHVEGSVLEPNLEQIFLRILPAVFL